MADKNDMLTDRKNVYLHDVIRNQLSRLIEDLDTVHNELEEVKQQNQIKVITKE